VNISRVPLLPALRLRRDTSFFDCIVLCTFERYTFCFVLYIEVSCFCGLKYLVYVYIYIHVFNYKCILLFICKNSNTTIVHVVIKVTLNRLSVHVHVFNNN